MQFSGISAATFVVSSTHPLSRESFTADCVFKEAAQPLAWWPKALIADIALLKWFILPVCLVGTCLLAIQTTADLHDYFALVAQVLAIVFTLYAVLRRSLTNQDQQEWEDAADGAIDRDYQDERIIGVTAIGAIAICLLEFLLTTKSIAQWDQEHLILIGDLHLLPARWLSVAIGTVHIALLTSLFRTLVFYYPDREFGQRLLHVRNKWFAERHLAASATAEAFEESVSTHNRRV